MLNCSIDVPSVEKLNDNELSVGRPFYLLCEGIVDPALNKETSQLSLEDPYSLKLLKVEKVSGSQVGLQVTSYRVASHELKNVRLSDGQTQYDLNIPRFEVRSVMKEQVKQPFGPFGPFQLHMGLLFWWLIASVILLFTAVIVSSILRAREKSARLLKVKEFDYALSPKDQLFRDIRTLKKNYLYMDMSSGKSGAVNTAQAYELFEKSFFVFLTREFLSLPFEWNLNKTFKFIKSSQKFSQGQLREFKIIINEIAKMRTLKKQNEIEIYDLKNILYRVEKWVEDLAK